MRVCSFAPHEMRCERCARCKRCERQTIEWQWQWQWQWQWILAEDVAVTLLEDGTATNFVRKVQAMWKKIINLGIIYCGLKFMVHSSVGSGMNRKYSFITISGHNTYCVSCWIEQTSGQANEREHKEEMSIAWRITAHAPSPVSKSDANQS